MKLITTDLDGTLLNSSHEISKENIEALKLAQKKGAEIAIATGRTYADAKAICERANICAHIISNNGSLTHSKDGKKLKADTIDKKYIKEALNWFNANGYFYQVGTAKNMFLPSNTKAILESDFYKAKIKNSSLSKDVLNNMVDLLFSQEGVMLVDDINDIINADLDYCSITSISFDEDKLFKGRELFGNHESLSLVISNEFNFEMVNMNASKGNSLEYLANHLNIPLKDVVAIGDNYNDISMFKKAGISVAMGNAKEDIKEICSYVSISNDLNGVAHAIHEFMNNLKVKSSLA
jgi:HAD-superfamily hydrolase, subfamily IIB